MRRDNASDGASPRPAADPGREVRPFRWAELTAASAPAAEGPAAEGPAAEPSPPPPPPPSAEELREALLAEARAEAEALLEAARREAEELREAARALGLEEGRTQGRAELEAAVERWRDAAQEIAAFKPSLLEAARAQVEELTLALVDRILGPLAEADAGAVTRVAGRGLQILSDRETVTLRVNPDDLSALLEAKPRLLQSFDGIKKLTVLEDHSVPRGGCLVETPTAEIDARLDTQLQELARALKKT